MFVLNPSLFVQRTSVYQMKAVRGLYKQCLSPFLPSLSPLLIKHKLTRTLLTRFSHPLSTGRPLAPVLTRVYREPYSSVWYILYSFSIYFDKMVNLNNPSRCI